MDIPDCLNHLSEPRVLSRFHFFTNHSQDTCSIQALKSTPIGNDPIQLYIFCNNRKNFLFQIQDKPGIDHFSKSIEFGSRERGCFKTRKTFVPKWVDTFRLCCIFWEKTCQNILAFFHELKSPKCTATAGSVFSDHIPLQQQQPCRRMIGKCINFLIEA